MQLIEFKICAVAGNGSRVHQIIEREIMDFLRYEDGSNPFFCQLHCITILLFDICIQQFNSDAQLDALFLKIPCFCLIFLAY